MSQLFSIKGTFSFVINYSNEDIKDNKEDFIETLNSIASELSSGVGYDKYTVEIDYDEKDIEIE